MTSGLIGVEVPVGLVGEVPVGFVAEVPAGLVLLFEFVVLFALEDGLDADDGEPDGGAAANALADAAINEIVTSLRMGFMVASLACGVF
ncbi:MAG TPA: hypothetical protein VF132_01235 [Rudaea sp.]